MTLLAQHCSTSISSLPDGRTATTVRDPIIIGNAPSSGSSLLRVLLSRLPGIATGGELGVLDKPELFNLPPRMYRRRMLRWLEHGYPGGVLIPTQLFAQLDEFPFTAEEVRTLCSQSADHAALVRSFFSELLTRTRARRWLEKTPGNVFAFPEIRAVFPTARFIHIVRDARDCAASLVQRGYAPFMAVTRWYCATLAGVQCRSWPNYFELRYEDLVQRPDETLSLLCDFLGEPYSSSLLLPRVGSDARLSTWLNDPNGDVSPRSVGRHRGETGNEIAAVLHGIRLTSFGERIVLRGGNIAPPTPPELQQLLGYEPPFEEPISTQLRRRARAEMSRLRWRTLRRFRRFQRFPTRLARET